MFKDAKIKLTSWYLLILMTITLSFSALVYRGVISATSRAFEAQKLRVERRLNMANEIGKGPKGPVILDIETLLEIREKTLQTLLIVNLAIFFVAGCLSYFLAGKTLAPIEEMMKKQKRFISDAAHDLKTPLTAMKAELEVTLRDKNPSITSLKDTLQSSVAEIDKLNLFINRLLTNTKYQNNKTKIEFTKLNLMELLEKLAKKYSPLAATNNQHIETKLIPINIYGNPDGITELFSNIIDNAIKYGKKDGTIKIRSSVADKFAVVEIEDDGIGIAKENILNIFEPFYRAEKSRGKNNTNGFGLGLSIVKEILHAHGGHIGVHSKVGEVTIFRISLPLHNRESKNTKNEVVFPTL